MSNIIIVEGIHDEMRLKSIYPELSVVTTNGREVEKSTIAMIQELSKQNEIIIFTDPDTPGEKIRQIITDAVPTAKQAFLRKKDCISKNKKKVGIEHASKECIIEALSHVYEPTFSEDTISLKDLYELGFNGAPQSAILREKVSELLNIGRPNAKTFLKRLNLIQITKEQLEEYKCKIK